MARRGVLGWRQAGDGCQGLIGWPQQRLRQPVSRMIAIAATSHGFQGGAQLRPRPFRTCRGRVIARAENVARRLGPRHRPRIRRADSARPLASPGLSCGFRPVGADGCAQRPEEADRLTPPLSGDEVEPVPPGCEGVADACADLVAGRLRSKGDVPVSPRIVALHRHDGEADSIEPLDPSGDGNSQCLQRLARHSWFALRLGSAWHRVLSHGENGHPDTFIPGLRASPGEGSALRAAPWGKYGSCGAGVAFAKLHAEIG
jgi:hypothetical protein